MSNEFFRNFLRKRNQLGYKIFMYLGINQEEKILYQTTLSKRFEKSGTTINYHITKLRQEGLINKELEFTGKGMRLFKYLWENASNEILRAHNIQIRFSLEKCPKDYIEKYSDKIIQIMTNTRYMGFKSEIKSSYGNITFMIYSREKIICVLKDIFANTDEEISAQVQLISMELQELIESEFEGIKIKSYSPVKIQTSHISILDAVFAESINLSGFTYEDKEIAIDKSHGRNEVELTNPKNNLAKIMELKRFLESIN